MNKTTCIALTLLCLLSACSEKMLCPAYQSAFILDDNYRERHFSPFEVVAGDTVPKDRFRVQKKRSDFFITKIWTRPERPVLETPYLMARIFNKRPYWKLDILEPTLIHYVNTDTMRIGTIPMGDSTQTGEPLDFVLRLPVRLPPYNQEQIEYNKKFGHLFPRPPKPVDPADSTESLAAFIADTLTTESDKKGIFGFLKKKNRPPKPKRQKKRDRKKNTEGTLEENLP